LTQNAIGVEVGHVMSASKHLLGRTRSQLGKRATGHTISMYAEHWDILLACERTYNVQRSVCVQILLEVEQRMGILRKELARRLSNEPSRRTEPPTPKQNESTKDGLEKPEDGHGAPDA
jgi:hypothetical protein